MTDIAYTLLLWAGAIGCGVMAGVYFAFSTFVMQALGAIAPQAGMMAMQSINRVIVRSPFLPLFFGSTIVAAVAVATAALDWHGAASPPLLAAGLIYLGGMFISTIVLNIPLNNRLETSDPASESGRALWTRYLSNWTARNHIRTIASTVASGLFVLALVSS